MEDFDMNQEDHKI